MNTETDANPKTDHASERPGGVRGTWALVLTLGIIVAVPLVTFAVWKAAQIEMGQPQPLEWAERADWPILHVQGTSLERGPMSSARTNQTYFEIESPITDEQEAAVWRGVQLARESHETFTSDQTIVELKGLTDQHPDLFYPRYLLAQATGDAAHMAEAVRLAPRVLVIPVNDEDGRRVKGRMIGDMELAVVRVSDDQIDESLVLRYPAMRTDELGRAYLPLFAGIYRILDAQPAAGITPTRVLDGYFTFPGQVGRLPAWVVMGQP